MKVINMFMTNGQGKIKAFYTVDLGPLVIRDIKLIESETGLWAAMPSKDYVDKKSGEKKWAGIIQVNDLQLMDKITELGRKAYNGEKVETEEELDIPF
ncbi:MAG: septation protein SpoVG family protein [Thermodesulfobacteriota bacterium]